MKSPKVQNVHFTEYRLKREVEHVIYIHYILIIN